MYRTLAGTLVTSFIDRSNDMYIYSTDCSRVAPPNDGSLRKAILGLSDFPKDIGVRVGGRGPDRGANFRTDIAAQKGIGAFLQTEEAGYRGSAVAARFLHRGDAGHQCGVARLDMGGELGVGQGIFVGTGIVLEATWAGEWTSKERRTTQNQSINRTTAYQ
jgi:hypothetical protein